MIKEYNSRSLRERERERVCEREREREREVHNLGQIILWYKQSRFNVKINV